MIRNGLSLSIAGPPELCMGNITNESQFTYTVCGVPRPTVVWGFMENDTKHPINATERPGIHYAHDYSLYTNSDMCGKDIYFKAVGYNNETYSWMGTHNMDCELLFDLCYQDYFIS